MRNLETVDTALKTLNFDAQRFKAALYWFINSSPFDNIALQHLSAGYIDKANSIWNKTQSLTSLYNLLITAASSRFCRRD